MPPPLSLPHLFPIFLFLSPCLPFLLVMRSIISQSFYTQEAAAWLLADVDKGWCCGCQAIQIISGIKRSIASFSKSSPLPRPPFIPSLFFTGRTKVRGNKEKIWGRQVLNCVVHQRSFIRKKGKKQKNQMSAFLFAEGAKATTRTCRHKGVFLFSVTDNVRMLYVIILLSLSKTLCLDNTFVFFNIMLFFKPFCELFWYICLIYLQVVVAKLSLNTGNYGIG